MNTKKLALMLAAGAMFGGVSVDAAAVETTFAGYTNGCFSLTCPPPSTSVLQTASIGGLTYFNSSFDVTTVLGVAPVDGVVALPNVDNLGSFSLMGAPSDYTGQTFDLRVTFTAPSGTTPATDVFTANISGLILRSSVGSLTIDFDNTARVFTFGNGTFNFFVNDVVDLMPSSPLALSGRFDTNVDAVPEPASLALLGLGLTGLALSRRRKAKAT